MAKRWRREPKSALNVYSATEIEVAADDLADCRSCKNCKSLVNVVKINAVVPAAMSGVVFLQSYASKKR